ncbi:MULTISPECIES: flagellar basal body rod protein FlgC [Enterobacteriaceae]|uniref:flagellar basal body rod protein FlgC n=1 Tax=Enterobacteriaceae TaxID=543 RepID=UPI00119DCA0D|nr:MULTISPECIES: flagellar basal body rod protein FlgC [Enterobacteriaceae]MCR4456437.1 flagellar basal body rod protein FlgC [Pseudescherichia sp. L3]
MSFSDIYQIAGSAMTAQTVRLNTVASNLANADSPAQSEAAVYKSRSPVFASVYHSSLVQAGQHDLTGASVRVQDVIESGSAVRRYEPHHPLADRDGYVWYPDVNVVEQMADMMSASHNFETGVDVLNNVKSMQQSLLKLGEST